MRDVQKGVLAVGLAFIILATLFPPYIMAYDDSTVYGFLLNPPVDNLLGIADSLKVSQLLLQYFVICTSTLLAYLLAGQKKTSQ